MFVRGEFLLHLQKHPCFSRLGRLAPEIPSVFDSVQQPFCFRPPRSSVSGCILLNSRFRQNFQGQTRQHVGSGFGLGVLPASRKAPSAPADLCRRPHILGEFSRCRLVRPPPAGVFLLPPCDHAVNSSQEQGRQRSAPPSGRRGLKCHSVPLRSKATIVADSPRVSQTAYILLRRWGIPQY